MVALLIQNGADVNVTFNERDDNARPPHPALSALRTALSSGHIEAARLIYRAGGSLFSGEVDSVQTSLTASSWLYQDLQLMMHDHLRTQ
jgi:hypothetical protein